MLNYAIDPAPLLPLVPPGTELDGWSGRTYVSMVGFLFLDTRVRGLAIPFHRHFEEVNLRFYVRRRGPEGWRRGVVFVRELVPRRAIAVVARLLYHEPYLALPMRHETGESAGRVRAAYHWRFRRRWHSLEVTAQGEPGPAAPGSEAEFITEHFWGYNAQRDGGTLEYRVEHPRWRVWAATDSRLEGELAPLYGPALAACLAASPTSAFLAEGSPVTVMRGTRI